MARFQLHRSHDFKEAAAGRIFADEECSLVSGSGRWNLFSDDRRGTLVYNSDAGRKARQQVYGLLF